MTYVAWINVVTVVVVTYKDGPRKLPSKLAKIGSITAKIFLIWTNVTRTNVAWTNVTAWNLI